MRSYFKQSYISYLRDKIKSYPDVRCGYWGSQAGGKKFVWIRSNGKRYETHCVDSKKGKDLIAVKKESDDCKRILLKLESEWIEDYGQPCDSIPLRKVGQTHNKRLFESLEVGKNPYKKNNKIEYNGTVYRSNLESDFAKLMDSYGIPFKYEPEIKVYTRRNRYPDFIIYLPWLDLLILVEIYGKSNDPEYIVTIRDRQYDYMMSGWMQGINMMSYYYYDKAPYLPEMIMEEIETVVMRNFLIMQYS